MTTFKNLVHPTTPTTTRESSPRPDSAQVLSETAEQHTRELPVWFPMDRDGIDPAKSFPFF